MIEIVGSEFMDNDYILDDDLKKKIDREFEWEKSYVVKPSSTTASSCPSKFTLYALCRGNDGTTHSKFSEGRKPILSIRKSNVDVAGFGVFAERQFAPGEYISVYLGKKYMSSRTPSDYALEITPEYYIDIDHGGDQLHLGAHKINDIGFYPEKESKEEMGSNKKRKIGSPIKNNAEYEGVLVRATSKILIGREIFVAYNYDKKTST